MINNNTNKKYFRSKDVLVTGGAGFIGSHLIEALLTLEANITGLDNYITGSISNHFNDVRYLNGRVSDIMDILGNDCFDYIFHDEEDSNGLEDIIKI